MTTANDALTAEQAEEMLQRLAKHFKEPVQPISRYCKALQTWAHAISVRARRLEDELLPNRYDYDKSDPKSWKNTPESEAQQAEYNGVKAISFLRALLPAGLPALKGKLSEGAVAEIKKCVLEDKPSSREYRLMAFLDQEELSDRVARTFMAIEKSNLLARLLYSGEKLRIKMCPEHKGVWSGIEWHDTKCPHGCQLTGWIPEPEDAGKVLPGVQAVVLVPTGDDPDKVTMVRDVDGTILGEGTVKKFS
jgi:hypothetical protein